METLNWPKRCIGCAKGDGEVKLEHKIHVHEKMISKKVKVWESSAAIHYRRISTTVQFTTITYICPSCKAKGRKGNMKFGGIAFAIGLLLMAGAVLLWMFFTGGWRFWAIVMGVISVLSIIGGIGIFFTNPHFYYIDVELGADIKSQTDIKHWVKLKFKNPKFIEILTLAGHTPEGVYLSVMD